MIDRLILFVVQTAMTASEPTQTYVNWEMVSAIGTLVAALAAVISLTLIIIAYRQFQNSKRWNKLNFTYTFFPNPVDLEKIEKDIDTVVGLWKRKESDPLEVFEIKALFGRELDNNENTSMDGRHSGWAKEQWIEAGRKLKLYTNLIEMYCAAINDGVADSDAAKDIYGFKFRAHFRKLKNYFDWIRKDRNEDNLYSEWETLIDKKWFPEKKAPKKERYK